MARKLPTLLALALGMASLSGTAFGFGSTSLRLNYQIQLIDLDVNDGITPGITMQASDLSSTGVLSTIGASSPVMRYDFGPLSWSDGVMTGNVQVDPLSGSMEIRSIDDRMTNGGFFQTKISLDSLLLTGNTALRFTGTIEGSTSSNPDSVSGTIQLRRETGDDGIPGGQLPVLSINDPDSEGSLSFDITAPNWGRSSTAYQLYVEGNLFGGSTPPSIPEPESYALMLAGLGAFGLHLRRRKNTVKSA